MEEGGSGEEDDHFSEPSRFSEKEIFYMEKALQYVRHLFLSVYLSEKCVPFVTGERIKGRESSSRCRSTSRVHLCG